MGALVHCGAPWARRIELRSRLRIHPSHRMVLSPFTRLIGLGVPGALFFLVVSLAAQRLHEILGFQFQFHPADFGQVFFRLISRFARLEKKPLFTRDGNPNIKSIASSGHLAM